MRSVLALLAALAPALALAQEPPDPRRNPLTGQPRPMFEPTSSEEAKLNLDACLDRALLGAPAAQAVEACHAEALAACEAIMALYPLARNQCPLGVRLAWSDVRHEAGLVVSDVLTASGDPGARKQADAFWAADDAWRVENRDACVTPDPAAHEACTLGREMDRAALYLARAMELLGARL